MVLHNFQNCKLDPQSARPIFDMNHLEVSEFRSFELLFKNLLRFTILRRKEEFQINITDY